MKYLDLFSGIGGFHSGLLNAGFTFDWCGFSEIDKYAKQVYQKHFPQSEDLGDVKTITTNKLPSIDIITFGFPCQDLSVAGKRAGLDGQRSGLFFEAIRIIKAALPKVFIFENVKGLLSDDRGRSFERVLRSIADIGLYDCEWQLVNTRWVLPQNRERIYFIGHLRGASRPKVFPFTEGLSNVDKTQGEGEGEGKRLWNRNYTGSLRSAGVDDGMSTLIQIGQIGNRGQGQRGYAPNGISSQLTAQGGGQGAKTGLYAVNASGMGGKDGFKESDIFGTIKSTYYKGLASAGSPAVCSNIDCSGYLATGKHKCDDKGKSMPTSMNEKRIRRLTPTECEKLQGFPDSWTATDTDDKSISDTQRYKTLGNAVTVPIVEMIGRRLLESYNLNRAMGA